MFSTQYKNNYRTIPGGTTASVYNDDSVLYCDTSTGAITINLGSIPANYWNTTWKLYIVDSGNNASVNNITVNAGTGQTINGQASVIINTNGDATLVRVGGNTQFISSYGADGITAYQYIRDEGASPLPQHDTINFTGGAVTATNDPINNWTTVNVTGGVQVKEDGVDKGFATSLDFIGNAPIVTNTSGATTVEVNAYQEVVYGVTPIPKETQLEFTGAGVTVTPNTGKTTVTISGGLGQAYTQIAEEGTNVTPQRSTLNFVGTAVTAQDNPIIPATDVTINAYHTIEEEGGGGLAQRGILNFIGDIVTVTDATTKTNVTIEIFQSLTITAMQSLISTNAVIKGKYYYITDAVTSWWENCAGVIVEGTSTSSISTTGNGVFYNADYQGVGTYSGSPVLLNLWTTNVNPSFTGIGNICIHNNTHWVNADGNYSPVPGSGSNWTQLTPSVANGYILEVDNVIYDLSNDRIISRQDKRGNEVEYTIAPGGFGIDFFQWGRDAVKWNIVKGGAYMSCRNSLCYFEGNIINGKSSKIIDNTSDSTQPSGYYRSNSIFGASYITCTVGNYGEVLGNNLTNGSHITFGTVSGHICNNDVSNSSVLDINSCTDYIENNTVSGQSTLTVVTNIKGGSQLRYNIIANDSTMTIGETDTMAIINNSLYGSTLSANISFSAALNSISSNVLNYSTLTLTANSTAVKIDANEINAGAVTFSDAITSLNFRYNTISSGSQVLFDSTVSTFNFQNNTITGNSLIESYTTATGSFQNNTVSSCPSFMFYSGIDGAIDNNSFFYANIDLKALASTFEFKYNKISSSSIRSASTAAGKVRYNVVESNSNLFFDAFPSAAVVDYNTLSSGSTVSFSPSSSSRVTSYIKNSTFTSGSSVSCNGGIHMLTLDNCYASNGGSLKLQYATCEIQLTDCEWSDGCSIEFAYEADVLSNCRYNSGFSNWPYTLNLAIEDIYDSGTGTLTIPDSYLFNPLYPNSKAYVGIFYLQGLNNTVINNIVNSPLNHPFTLQAGNSGGLAINLYFQLVPVNISLATTNKIITTQVIKNAISAQPECYYRTSYPSDYAVLKYITDPGAGFAKCNTIIAYNNYD